MLKKKQVTWASKVSEMISSSITSMQEKLSTSQHMAYVAPSMMLAFLFGPIGILQGIYAKHFGVALTTIATVLLVSRLFDAITDPIIGYWSDRHHAKTGTRKPFIVAGGLLFIVSSYFLYVPVDLTTLGPETRVSGAYFLIWFLLFYLAWTLLEIPHLAWGAELANSAKAKNKIFSLRASSMIAGLVLFYLIPFLPFFANNEFTPQTLQWTAIAAALMMLPVLYLCVRVTPNGVCSEVGNSRSDSVWVIRQEIISNKPFLLFTGAFCLYGVAGGMWFTLMFIFVDAYLKLGNHFALLTLIALSSSVVCLGFWYWLANRFSKKLAWGLGALCYAFGIVTTGFLQVGQTEVVGLALVMLLAYIGTTCVAAMSPAFLADIIEYGHWKSGADRSATYFSFYTLASKTALALGGSIGLGIAGWAGFDPSSIAHSSEAIWGLRIAACWLPATVMILAVVVMAIVPINARHSLIISRRLDRQRQYELVSTNKTKTGTSPCSTIAPASQINPLG